MLAKKIDVNALTVSEILALLEIFEGFYGARPDWIRLRKRLAAQDSWLLMDGESVAGCALLTDAHGLMDSAVMLTEFVYRWEYNEETHIHQMLRAIAQAYQPAVSCLLLDVSRRHECNLACYQRFGFQASFLCSPNGWENVVLIKALNHDAPVDDLIGVSRRKF